MTFHRPPPRSSVSIHSLRGARLLAGTVLASFLVGLNASAQGTRELSPLVVTATRAAQEAVHLPVTVDLIGRAALADAPGLAIDDVLKQSAAFSLFRRNGSLMANPTTQGVSLRNLGPSAAGRTLVLIDGIPLNDPFGGWVTWTKLPRLTLAQAEIVRGGGSSAWGSAALGGTVQLLTDPNPRPAPGEASANTTAQLRLDLGDFSTRSAELLATATRDAHRLHVAGRTFRTGGFWRVDAADRGMIDRRTDSDHQLAQVGWTYETDHDVTLGINARIFREDRGNGTPFQRNQSEEQMVSARASGRWSPDADWTATLYAQKQDFANGFSAVGADRNSETPSLDQYAIPADAAGAALTTSWRHDETASTTLGGDLRWVQAETQEAYFLDQGRFARRRFAGGEQQFTGIFIQHTRPVLPAWQLTVGGRVDQWENTAGRRREVEHASGQLLRDDVFSDRDGVRFSPSAGLVWQARENLRWRAAAYRAFRVPTLNELYRPFRVGNVLTEANPELAVEWLDGYEVGLDWTLPRGFLSATVFRNDVHDLVANITVGRGAGTFPGVGFVPAGVVARQKQNLARAQVEGLELTARWSVHPSLELRADYLLSRSTVQEARGPAAPLAGRRLAQSPRHTIAAGAEWRPGARWRAGGQVRAVSQVFEDDANTLTLAAATVVDLRVAYRWIPARANEVFLSVENVLNEVIESGRDANGRADLGPPRFAHGGVSWVF